MENMYEEVRMEPQSRKIDPGIQKDKAEGIRRKSEQPALQDEYYENMQNPTTNFAGNDSYTALGKQKLENSNKELEGLTPDDQRHRSDKKKRLIETKKCLFCFGVLQLPALVALALSCVSVVRVNKMQAQQTNTGAMLKQLKQDLEMQRLMMLHANNFVTGSLKELKKHMEHINITVRPLTSVPQDCQAWKETGALISGKYYIDGDGNGPNGPFIVECDMSSRPAKIKVNHDFGGRQTLTGGRSGGYTFYINYPGLTNAQLAALATNRSCKQYWKYECYESPADYWLDRNGEQPAYWPGGPQAGIGCKCQKTNSCYGGKICNCANNDKTWRFDDGYLTEASRLPITKIRLSDYDGSHEKGYLTIAPLICI